MTNVHELPNERKYTYRDVNYTILRKDDRYYWSFNATELGLPVAKLAFHGISPTLVDAVNACNNRIDATLEAMGAPNE